MRGRAVFCSCCASSLGLTFVCNVHGCSDPESDIPFAKVLYGNDAVMQSFYDSLSDHGILVMQLGESADANDADESHTAAKNRAATTELLTRVGFESIHAYEEVSVYPHMFRFFVHRHVVLLCPDVAFL